MTRRAVGARRPIRRYLVRVSFWGRVDAGGAAEARFIAINEIATTSIKDLPFERVTGLGFWWDNQTIHAQEIDGGHSGGI